MDVTAVWLIIRDKKSLDEIEQEDLATFCQASPTLKRTYDLVQDFMQMVRKREGIGSTLGWNGLPLAI